MATLHLDQLLAALPPSPGGTVLPIVSATHGMQYVTTGLKEFVAPNLADRADVENPPIPAVAVISAAGAVGKSTLAREIARAKSAPLWDLSQSGPVGQHTLNGALINAFGPPSIANVHHLLESSKLFIVIDALDEARVKVNEPSFEAFIQDIASLATGASSIRFLLLGRTQVAETTWLLLEDAGVRTALHIIEPFNRQQANQYIERRIRVLPGPGARNVDEHRRSFEAARDVIFDHLERALAHGEAAAQFLGYAPVLDSIAVLLAGEANWHALKERLEAALRSLDSTAPQGHLALLEVVVKNVLAREHNEKVASTMRPALEATAAAHGWSAWSILYTPEEQWRRLLARILGIAINYSLEMPRPLKQEYEERLESWLPEHPFLRDGRYAANVVFESYLYALGLFEQAETTPALYRRLSEPSYKPSRLFADFYFLSLGRDSELPEVPPAHLGWLYDSFLSAETDTSFVRLSLDGPDPSEAIPSKEPAGVDGEFVFHAVSASGGAFSSVSSREFRMCVHPTDVITFGRYVRDVAIAVPCTIALGGSATEFEIGPSVYILSHELRLDAKALIVGGHTRPRVLAEQANQTYDDSVILETPTFVGSLVNRPITRVPLKVNWPGASAFPWTDFRSDRAAELGGDPRLHEAYRRFRRIVMTLRSNARGGLARYAKKVEHSRVLKGTIGETLLGQLLADGILNREGSYYHWAPEKASHLVGISWLQLRRGESSSRLTAYLQRFVNSNARLFAR